MLITQNESEAIKMDARQKRNKVLGERVVKALESRNMDAYYAETKEEAVNNRQFISNNLKTAWRVYS